MTKVQVSPHGGYLVEGAISSGTLRTQDLLRAFANEYLRLYPFNGQKLYNEAYAYAAQLDEGGHVVDEDGTLVDMQEIVQELQDELNHLASPHGLYFGTTEGDGACFGFWKEESEDA